MERNQAKNDKFLLNETVFNKYFTLPSVKMEKYREFSYTNIKNGIPFYREWTVLEYLSIVSIRCVCDCTNGSQRSVLFHLFLPAPNFQTHGYKFE